MSDEQEELKNQKKSKPNQKIDTVTITNRQTSTNLQNLLTIIAIIGLLFSGWQSFILNEQLSEQIRMNSPIINFVVPACPEVLISKPSIFNFTIRNDGNSPLLFNISINSSDNLRVKFKNVDHNFLYAKIVIRNPNYNLFEYLINEIRHSITYSLIHGQPTTESPFNSTLMLSIPAKEERTFQYSIEIPTNITTVSYQIIFSDLSFEDEYVYTFNCNYLLNKTLHNKNYQLFDKIVT